MRQRRRSCLPDKVPSAHEDGRDDEQLHDHIECRVGVAVDASNKAP
jgi:hypothetical protein